MINKAGTYKAKATDEVTLGQSRTKGTPFVGLYFKVTEGEFAGQLIKWEGWMTANTAERVLQSLQYCGWRGDDISELPRNPNGLCDNEVEIVVEMEPYTGDDPDKQGKSYPKVQWVNRAGGKPKFAGDAMDVAQAAAFGQKFRGLAMALKAKAGAVPSNTTSKSTGTDDIPF
jgi:hypothetical protein